MALVSGKVRPCTWLQNLKGRSFSRAVGREHSVLLWQENITDSGKVLLPTLEDKYFQCFGGQGKRQEKLSR